MMKVTTKVTSSSHSDLICPFNHETWGSSPEDSLWIFCSSRFPLSVTLLRSRPNYRLSAVGSGANK
eukprot:scaffold6167_cov44-Cyclotella_meneghiniana.AAC.7